MANPSIGLLWGQWDTSMLHPCLYKVVIKLMHCLLFAKIIAQEFNRKKMYIKATVDKFFCSTEHEGLFASKNVCNQAYTHSWDYGEKIIFILPAVFPVSWNKIVWIQNKWKVVFAEISKFQIARASYVRTISLRLMFLTKTTPISVDSVKKSWQTSQQFCWTRVTKMCE